MVHGARELAGVGEALGAPRDDPTQVLGLTLGRVVQDDDLHVQVAEVPPRLAGNSLALLGVTRGLDLLAQPAVLGLVIKDDGLRLGHDRSGGSREGGTREVLGVTPASGTSGLGLGVGAELVSGHDAGSSCRRCLLTWTTLHTPKAPRQGVPATHLKAVHGDLRACRPWWIPGIPPRALAGSERERGPLPFRGGPLL